MSASAQLTIDVAHCERCAAGFETGDVVAAVSNGQVADDEATVHDLQVFHRSCYLNAVRAGAVTNETATDSTDQPRGEWVGPVRGLSLREPGPDADGPILEIHGEDGMAAMEFDDEEFVEALTHLAAEIQMVHDRSPETHGQEESGE